jgi:hypothetical protein
MRCAAAGSLVKKVRAIYNDARAVVHDPAGFVVDAETAQAADDFLSVSAALVH